VPDTALSTPAAVARRARALAALALPALVAICAAWGVLRVQMEDPWRGEGQRVAAYDRHLEPMRALLRACEITEVGFVVGPVRLARKSAHLLLTQYGLAPVLVVDTQARRFVVASFRAEDERQDVLDTSRMVLVESFPGGLALLRNDS
jgi:hypothetical protein